MTQAKSIDSESTHESVLNRTLVWFEVTQNVEFEVRSEPKFRVLEQKRDLGDYPYV